MVLVAGTEVLTGYLPNNRHTSTCEKTAEDKAKAQRKDETSSIAIKIIRSEISATDISDEEMPDSVDNSETTRYVAQGRLLELSDSQKLIVKRLSVEPAPRVGRPTQGGGSTERRFTRSFWESESSRGLLCATIFLTSNVSTESGISSSDISVAEISARIISIAMLDISSLRCAVA